MAAGAGLAGGRARGLLPYAAACAKGFGSCHRRRIGLAFARKTDPARPGRSRSAAPTVVTGIWPWHPRGLPGRVGASHYLARRPNCAPISAAEEVNRLAEKLPERTIPQRRERCARLAAAERAAPPSRAIPLRDRLRSPSRTGVLGAPGDRIGAEKAFSDALAATDVRRRILLSPPSPSRA